MALDTKTIEGVASRLRGAAESGNPIAPIRDELARGGVAAAYAVQNANTEHALKQGRRLVGRKIGLTSKSVQKQLGVDSPDFGMLFADMAFNDNEEVALNKVMQPKVEAEVAFVLEKDLTHEQVTLPDLISAVAYACRRSRSSAAASRSGTSSSSTPWPTTPRRDCSSSAPSRASSTASTCACAAW